MSAAEQDPQSASVPKIGFRAPLANRFHLPGGTLPSHRARRLLSAFVLSAAAALLVPAAALAVSATTEPATVVRGSTATLNAHIDPTGDPGITECRFDYVTEAAFTSTGFTDLSSGGNTPCSGTAPYTSPADVTAQLSGLLAGETYRFAVLVITTSSGTIEGTAASFTTVHGLLYSFGPDGTSGSFFEFPHPEGEEGRPSLVFQNATRRLYLLEGRTPGIWGFDASAPPAYPGLLGFAPFATPPLESRLSFAVDNTSLPSAGNIYLPSFKSDGNTATSNEKVFGYNASGVELPGFPVEGTSEVYGVAVDAAGTIWVSHGLGKPTSRFTSAGTPLDSLELGSDTYALAFDSNDDLYTVTSSGELRKYSAASDYTTFTTVDSGFPAGPFVSLAVDRRNHHLYAAYADQIKEYDAAGELVDVFGAGISGAEYSGLAVDPTNHYLYVADNGTDIDERQVLTIDNATGRTYKLSFEGQSTGATGAGDMSSAGAATGTGDITGASNTITHVTTSTGAFSVGQTISAFDAEIGTRENSVITAVEPGTLTLSRDVFGTTGLTRVGVALTADVRNVTNLTTATGAFTVGEQISGPGIPPATTITAVDPEAKTLILSTAVSGAAGAALSAELPFDADGAAVQNALRALPTIGAGNVQVNGSGSVSPIERTVEFTGKFAGTDVPLLGVDGSGLTPAPPASEITAATTVTGSVLDPSQVRVFAPGARFAALALSPPAPLANTTATLHGTVGPEGDAITDCHFDWVSDAAFQKTGFTDLSSGGSAPCNPAAGSISADNADHPVSAAISGLTRATTYQYRLSASTAAGPGTTTASFTTASPPTVETTGSPLPSPTSAELSGRLNPHLAPTEYHFEYGTQGPCSDPADACTATAPQAAGQGSEIELVAQTVSGLAPDTTYYYRLVAGNGNPGGPAAGVDMTLHTNSPLSHGAFPGPPGSDRAYEQVSIPDSSGNPVSGANAIAADGDHLVYTVAGGTSISDAGSLASTLFAQRTETAPHQGAWRQSLLVPSSRGGVGLFQDVWGPFLPSAASPQFVAVHSDGKGHTELWRVDPGTSSTELISTPQSQVGGFFASSGDASRVVTAVQAKLDPAFPTTKSNVSNLYDVSTPGEPHLLSILPGGAVPSCGVDAAFQLLQEFFDLSRVPTTAQGWLSDDGNLAFFPSRGSAANCATAPTQLYVRDIAAAQTTRISPPPLSGPDCGAAFIRSTPNAVFFWTQSRLLAADQTPSACDLQSKSPPGGDVYRYGLEDQSLTCLTCLTGGPQADVFTGSPAQESLRPLARLGVSANGSRLYFISPNRLLPGAAKPGIYRLDVASGDLAYVGSGAGDPVVGDTGGGYSALSADGSVLVFRSAAPGLNILGGPQNAGTPQYYRYDDTDRSLVCVSCPPDGSPPAGPVHSTDPEGAGLTNENTAGDFAVSADGQTFAFTAPSSLTPGDQNTAPAGQDPNSGTDAYEWRGGRALLITDGLTNWPTKQINFSEESESPFVSGVSPSGRDVFFTAPAQYTPDALDGYRRLYDARLGGGFEFPAPPQPCPLEVCQGTPKGTPEEQPPGTSDFRGPGNPSSQASRKCPKSKARKHGRCVTKHPKSARRHRHHHRAANHHRRVPR